MEKTSNFDKKELSVDDLPENIKREALQKMVDTGKQMQQLLQTDVQLKEVDKMNDALKEAMRQNLVVDKIRQLIARINRNDSSELPISDSSPYKYAYWLYELASFTNNEGLIDYAKEIKRKELKHDENK